MNNFCFHLVCTSFIVILLSLPLAAQERHSYRVCSQNLYRYGEKHAIKSPQGKKQREYLVSRMSKAACSLIALQEVTGKNEREASRVLDSLVQSLQARTAKSYEVILSRTNDSYIRNAFLVSKNDFLIEDVEYWNDHLVPQFDYRGAPRGHARGPLAVTLRTHALPQNRLFVVTDHLKSKTRAWKDPTNTEFEFGRVSSAAHIKNQLLKKRSNNAIEIFLGDRNTDTGSATAHVLSGALSFGDFKRNGVCEISSYGSPLCDKTAYKKPDFIPVLETLRKENKKEIYTYKTFRPEILDEVYIFEEDMRYIKNRFNEISAGVEGEYKKGSDHLLIWVEIFLYV